jgi:hypothetical protein
MAAALMPAASPPTTSSRSAMARAVPFLTGRTLPAGRVPGRERRV